MRRLISQVGALLLTWTILGGVAWAGAEAGVRRVAVLTPGLSFSPVLEGLREGLSHLGYREGRNITYAVEDTNGFGPEVAAKAAALVAAKPDVLVTIATSHTTAAKKASTTLPIVFAWVGDPVRSGFVASYAASNSNLTGVTSYAGPLSGKRLELLTQAAPGIKRVLAVVATHDSIAETSFEFARQAARKLGVEIIRRDATTMEAIVRALHSTPKGSVDAIYHIPSGLVGAHVDLLIARAKADRIPLVVHDEKLVRRGALLSYGADGRSVGMQAAKLVTKILDGAKPSEIPTQIPEKLLLAVNISTARAIGLTIPRDVLDQVDQFVE